MCKKWFPGDLKLSHKLLYLPPLNGDKFYKPGE